MSNQYMLISVLRYDPYSLLNTVTEWRIKGRKGPMGQEKCYWTGWRKKE